MPIFKLSAPETVRKLMLSGHILPRSESNFTHSHLDFKKKFAGEKPPDLCLQWRGGEGKGLKGSYQLYVALSPLNYSNEIDTLQSCLSAIHVWFCENGMALVV